MGKLFIITPSMAAFIASCMEIGCEGAPDDAFADVHSEPTAEVIAEFRSWADSNVDLELTFDRHEDDADTARNTSAIAVGDDGEPLYDADGLLITA